MGIGAVLAIAMACLAVLSVAKMRARLDEDEMKMIVLARGDRVSPGAGMWVLVAVVLFVLFLAAVLPSG
jgi:hypothetical protein